MKAAPPERPRLFAPRRVLALLVAVACGWAAYGLYGETSQTRSLDARVTQLKAGNAGLEAQIAQRSLEIAAASSSAWVEAQARKLGYVMPGEKVYVLDPGGKSTPSFEGVPATPPTFDPPSPTPTPTPTATPTPSATTAPTPSP
jgi:cell division protein FtsB